MTHPDGDNSSDDVPESATPVATHEEFVRYKLHSPRISVRMAALHAAAVSLPVTQFRYWGDAEVLDRATAFEEWILNGSSNVDASQMEAMFRKVDEDGNTVPKRRGRYPRLG